MLHACIDNNIVVEIVDILDENHYQDLTKKYVTVLNIENENPQPQVNWKFIGNVFLEEDDSTPLIPDHVTPRQIRIALIISGFDLTAIENTINQLSSPDKEIALVSWNHSTLFYRNNPLINSLAPLLGLSQSQIDDLFILANTL